LPVGVAVLGAFAFLALGSANAGVEYLNRHTPHGRELAVGRYVREHAPPGDTQYRLAAVICGVPVFVRHDRHAELPLTLNPCR
jgi:hypothetical protein